MCSVGGLVFELVVTLSFCGRLGVLPASIGVACQPSVRPQLSVVGIWVRILPSSRADPLFCAACARSSLTGSSTCTARSACRCASAFCHFGPSALSLTCVLWVSRVRTVLSVLGCVRVCVCFRALAAFGRSSIVVGRQQPGPRTNICLLLTPFRRRRRCTCA
jgi:hypothetical protein